VYVNLGGERDLQVLNQTLRLFICLAAPGFELRALCL
jgi:hypothetical protein